MSSNLIRFDRILCDYTPNTSELGHLQDVQSFGHVERHYATRLLVHMVLSCLRQCRRAAQHDKNSVQHFMVGLTTIGSDI